MSIIVQKFGGTSVADSEKILAAARKAIRAQMEGNQVVTVVSAMGHSTDHLVDLARQITSEPPAREMDMLLATGEQVSVALMAMAIHALGHEAISMTGAQLGIRTDSVHTKARIHSIATDRIREALNSGKIVIAAGFQGVNEDYDITTLGRGGSDTTAVALAAALHGASCEIYTDVDGVYTTDPRVVPEARRMERISYDEMLELASLGAGVMHGRSIEFAKKFSVPVHVRSSFSDAQGTIITSEPEVAGRAVCGAAVVRDEARVTVQGVPDRPGAANVIFSKIAAMNIAMDMIVQNVGEGGTADISFTVQRGELPVTLRAVDMATREIGAAGYHYDDNVSKISIVGLGMAEQPGVAEKMFGALAEKGINIQMITTSEIKISVLVARDFAQEALRTVHETFELHLEPAASSIAVEGTKPRRSWNAGEMLTLLNGMEKLVIESISLDTTQARVTAIGLSDIPGLAAQVFEEVAEAEINVDMIVQSVGQNNRANISFTVPQDSCEKAVGVIADLSKRLKCHPPTSSPRVAKLTLTGVGMRSHTDVAARVFRSLAAAGINIDMISTSEVLVNVVIDGDRGEEGLAILRKELDDVLL